MNKLILIVLFFAYNLMCFSQDIDVFQRKKNDNFKFENINPEMGFAEYQILSRDLRMKEMLYSAIMPGYIHFYAKENRYGYAILALKTAAYAEIAYMLTIKKVNLSLVKTKNTSVKEVDGLKTERYITYSAIGVVMATYLYDWMHGQYILNKKQEKIRYKYNMKMNLSLVNDLHGNPVPGISLNFQF